MAVHVAGIGLVHVAAFSFDFATIANSWRFAIIVRFIRRLSWRSLRRAAIVRPRSFDHHALLAIQLANGDYRMERR
jgi:hypothetical protein